MANAPLSGLAPADGQLPVSSFNQDSSPQIGRVATASFWQDLHRAQPGRLPPVAHHSPQASLDLSEILEKLLHDPNNAEAIKGLNTLASCDNWMTSLLGCQLLMGSQQAIDERDFLAVWENIHSLEKRDQFLTCYYYYKRQKTELFTPATLAILQAVYEHHPCATYKAIIQQLITYSETMISFLDQNDRGQVKLSCLACIYPDMRPKLHHWIESAQKLVACHGWYQDVSQYLTAALLLRYQEQPFSAYENLNDGIAKRIAHPVQYIADLDDQKRDSGRRALQLFALHPSSETTASSEIEMRLLMMEQMVYRILSFSEGISSEVQDLLLEHSLWLRPHKINEMGLHFASEPRLALSIESRFYDWIDECSPDPHLDPKSIIAILSKAKLYGCQFCDEAKLRLGQALSKKSAALKQDDYRQLLDVVQHYNIPIYLNQSEPSSLEGNNDSYQQRLVAFESAYRIYLANDDQYPLLCRSSSSLEYRLSHTDRYGYTNHEYMSALTLACACGSFELIQAILCYAKSNNCLEEALNPLDGNYASLEDKRRNNHYYISPLEGALFSGRLSVVTLLFDWGLKLRTNPEPAVPNPRINLAGKTIIPLALRTQSSDILELLIEKAYQQLGLDGAYAFLRDGLQDWIHLPINQGDIRMCQLLKKHEVPIASSLLPRSLHIQIIQPEHHETIRPLIADKPILAFTLGIT